MFELHMDCCFLVMQITAVISEAVKEAVKINVFGSCIIPLPNHF